MACRIRRKHNTSLHSDEAEWHVFESLTANSHDEAPQGDVFYEDSELTVAVQWQAGKGSWNLVIGSILWEPTFQNKDRGIALYVVPLTNGVGRIRLSLRGPDNQQYGRLDRRILRRKLTRDEDLQALERHWALTRLPITGMSPKKVSYDLMGTVPTGGDPADPLQWTRGIHDRAERLLRSAKSIQERPHHNVSVETRHLPVRSLRRPYTSALLTALQGRRIVHHPHPRWGPDPEARKIAAIHAKRIERMIQRVKEAFEDVGGHALDPKLEITFRRLEKTLRQLRAQGRTGATEHARPKPRQALLHDVRYRHLEHAARLTRRDRQFSEGPIESLRPGTNDLYEEWCAGALIEEIASEDQVQALKIELAKPGNRSVMVQKEDKLLYLAVQYEMGLHGGPIMDRHRPDFLIRLEDHKKVVILDAKYRIDPDDPTRPPTDAVNELHRYRDVYRLIHAGPKHKEIWAAVLFPPRGITDKKPKLTALYEKAIFPEYRIGAVPLTPSLRAPLREYLKIVI